MPTYQYVCTSCETPLEVHQSFTDAALTECPSCGGSLRKVYNAVGVVFKGSGFYKTDSREAAKTGRTNGSSTDKSGTSSSDKPADSSGEKSGSSSDSSGTQSKSEKKTEKSTAAATA